MCGVIQRHLAICRRASVLRCMHIIRVLATTLIFGERNGSSNLFACVWLKEKVARDLVEGQMGRMPRHDVGIKESG